MSGSSTRSSKVSVTSRSTMPNTRSVQPLSVDRGRDQRGVDAVEVGVGDDERGQPVDGERRVRAGRRRPGRRPRGISVAAAVDLGRAALEHASAEAAADDREPAEDRPPGRGTSAAPAPESVAVGRSARRRAWAERHQARSGRRRARPAWIAADTSTSVDRAAGEPQRRQQADARRSRGRSPIAAPIDRRASRPTPAPTRTTTATTNTVSAVLSLVPNRATMKSLEPGGAKSMIAAPDRGDRRGDARRRGPRTARPTASATSAATTPASAASPRRRDGRCGDGRRRRRRDGWRGGHGLAHGFSVGRPGDARMTRVPYARTSWRRNRT